MTRYHNIDGVQVPFTEAEELAQDAAEAYAADPQREVEATDLEETKMMNRVEIKGIDRAQFAALLDHENRIRALESRPSVTAQDLKNWVKARL